MSWLNDAEQKRRQRETNEERIRSDERLRKEKEKSSFEALKQKRVTFWQRNKKDIHTILEDVCTFSRNQHSNSPIEIRENADSYELLMERRILEIRIYPNLYTDRQKYPDIWGRNFNIILWVPYTDDYGNELWESVNDQYTKENIRGLKKKISAFWSKGLLK